MMTSYLKSLEKMRFDRELEMGRRSGARESVVRCRKDNVL